MTIPASDALSVKLRSLKVFPHGETIPALAEAVVALRELVDHTCLENLAHFIAKRCRRCEIDARLTERLKKEKG
jgi:hypothetical protein